MTAKDYIAQFHGTHALEQSCGASTNRISIGSYDASSLEIDVVHD